MHSPNPKPDTLSPQAKRPPWHWFESLTLGILALIGADIIVSLLLGITGSVLENTPLGITNIDKLLEEGSIIFNFMLYGLSRLLGFGLIVAFIHRRGITLRQFGFKGFKLGQGLLLVSLAGVILLIATIVTFLILQQIAPQVNLEQTQDIVFAQASGGLQIALAFIALVVIAPIVEEAIFRGFMLPVFVHRFGLGAGIVITSVLFGLIHWQVNVGIVTFIMGLLLGWLYYKTRSLWPAIMFHSLKNLVAFILIFYP